ncbi:MAG TPA: RNA 2'-phosphotransferase [Mycobacteriales bacterium]|nr:RNA 2'-phosphotransferase [Mycobacteriales bacterium]
MHDQELSKVVSHALRHEPWRYELELDARGWVPVEQLLEAVRPLRPRWSGLAAADLERMIATSQKTRHEMSGGKIRALYGHSVPQRLERVAAAPPDVLYHGTSPRVLESIRVAGLVPMSRQYVHLSPTVAVAREVGGRKSDSPVLLEVDAARAHAEGVAFYRGNDVVWLADAVPPQYLR